MPKIIRTKVISQNHNDLLAGHFEINKTRELMTKKYYQKTFWQNIKSYIKIYDVCLASKVVRYKLYSDH